MLRKLKKAFKCVQFPMGRRGLRHGVAMTTGHLPVLQGLPELETIVDIGANRGQFSIAAHTVFPNATIHAFEPLLEPGATFRKIFENISNVQLNSCAVGPRKEKSTMHIARKDDSSSLLRIGVNQTDIFPGTEEIEQIEVTTERLSSILAAADIQRPALLKLDVQGYEKSALEGCEELLECFSFIYAECSFVELYEGQALADAVIEFLRVKGFILTGVHNVFEKPRGHAIQGDFLFTNRTA
jgi:FkbM family methyltransferase